MFVFHRLLKAMGLAAILAMAAPALAQGPDEVLAADRAFAALSRKEGAPAAFARYLADDAVKLDPGRAPVTGKAAIVQAMRAAWDPRATLDWQPQGGAVAASGDLAYSWGLWTYSGPDESGVVKISHGKYLTVWRRGKDGAWRVIADSGNAGPAPAAGK
ncbi:MAG: YybH family protein [Pseudomonadota bacterium]